VQCAPYIQKTVCPSFLVASYPTDISHASAAMLWCIGALLWYRYVGRWRSWPGSGMVKDLEALKHVVYVKGHSVSRILVYSEVLSQTQVCLLPDKAVFILSA